MTDQPTTQDTWDALLCEVDYWGSRRWVDENGELHRENGPALIHPTGDRYWFHHGKLHREHGPAIVRADGVTAYCLFGKWVSSNKYYEWKKSNARKLTVNG